jgi:hypothetical protein
MRFWAKSRVIFNAFRDNAKASLRQVAVPTGGSKRSVHRLGQARARRNCPPESWWWETEEGRRGFLRLGVAVLYGFGRQRGGGAATSSALCVRLPLERPVGCAPSALRGMTEARARGILATAEAWEGEGSAGGEPRPLIGAVEATFLARMRGMGLALVSGSLGVAEVAAERT